MADGEAERIRRLEVRVAALERRWALLDAEEDAAVEEATVEELPGPRVAAPTLPPERAAPPPRVEPARSPEPAAAASPPRDLESLLGANWLAKAGILTLVLGVAFFLKYAFDNDWISLTGRIVLGILGGLALWVTGDLLERRERYGVYPQVLAGGGAVIVYFSVFAAYAFEAYRAEIGLSQELDHVLLGVTALGLAGYAAWRDLPVLASEALALGAVTALVSEALGAFSVVYVVLLAAALATAAAWRRWAYVTAATLAGSYGTLAVLLALDVPAGHVLWGSLALLALFVVVGLRTTRADAERDVLAPFAAGALFAAAWAVSALALTVLEADAWRGPLTAALALAAMGLALVRIAPRETRLGWGVAGVALALVWPPVQFDGVAVAVAWAAMALAAAGLALARQWQPARLAGGAALALVTVRLVFVEGAQLAQDELGAWLALGPFVLASLAAAALWRGEARGESEDALSASAPFLVLVGLPTLYLWAALDATWVPVAWALVTLAAVAAAVVLRTDAARAAALVLALVTTLHLVVVQTLELIDGSLSPWLALVAFGAATVAALVAWSAEGRQEDDKAELMGRVFLVDALVLPIVYLGAALDGFQVSIAWAALGLAVVVIGFATRVRDLRMASFGIFALVLGRVFLVDMADLEVVYRIVTFLAVGAILLVASFLYARALKAKPA